jgi:hypothetical protein
VADLGDVLQKKKKHKTAGGNKHQISEVVMFMHSAVKLAKSLCSLYIKRDGVRPNAIWTSERIQVGNRRLSGIDVLASLFLNLGEGLNGSQDVSISPFEAGGSFNSIELVGVEDNRGRTQKIMYWVISIFSLISAYSQLDAASIQEKFMNNPNFYSITKCIRKWLEADDHWTGAAILVPFTRFYMCPSLPFFNDFCSGHQPCDIFDIRLFVVVAGSSKISRDCRATLLKHLL